jgi:hypothetical protein
LATWRESLELIARHGMKSNIGSGFPDDPEEAMRQLLDSYEWHSLLGARNLVFDFGRRMATFQFFVWMQKHELPTQFMIDGLIELNFVLREFAFAFPPHVRMLLRPSLVGGLHVLKSLLERAEVYRQYMEHYNEVFDEYYGSNMSALVKSIDHPDFMRRMNSQFPLAARL